MKKKSTHSFDNKFSLDYIDEVRSSLITDVGAIYYKPYWEVLEEPKRRAKEAEERRAKEAEEEAKRRAKEAEEEAKRRAKEAEEEAKENKHKQNIADYKQKVLYIGKISGHKQWLKEICQDQMTAIHRIVKSLKDPRNAVGFEFRQTEKRLKEKIFKKRNPDYNISSFLENAFGKIVGDKQTIKRIDNLEEKASIAFSYASELQEKTDFITKISDNFSEYDFINCKVCNKTKSCYEFRVKFFHPDKSCKYFDSRFVRNYPCETCSKDKSCHPDKFINKYIHGRFKTEFFDDRFKCKSFECQCTSHFQVEYELKEISEVIKKIEEVLPYYNKIDTEYELIRECSHKLGGMKPAYRIVLYIDKIILTLIPLIGLLIAFIYLLIY